MPTTPEQVHALFRRRSEQIPDSLKDWYSKKTQQAQKVRRREAYLWGRKCLKGAAVSDPNGASKGRLDVYVNSHPGSVDFEGLLGSLFPDVTPRVVVVSRFRAVQAAA